jgi:hypothetical protein
VSEFWECLVAGDNKGQRCVGYYGPTALDARYHLGADLAAKLAAIDSLTDALVAQ